MRRNLQLSLFRQLQDRINSDEHGNVVNGKANMTLTHVGLPEGDMETQTTAGWNECLEKLVESLK